MDFINKVMPLLWQIVEKKKSCAINVSTIDKKLTINILLGRRRKIFSDPNGDVILTQLKEFLAA